MLVVDASVFLKWFRKEEGSDRASQYLADFLEEKEQVVAPFLMQYELFNAVVTKSNTTMEDVLGLISILKELSIPLFGLTEQQTRQASILAIEKKISFYDASYIALAHILKCDLITADKKLVEKVKLPFVKLL